MLKGVVGCGSWLGSVFGLFIVVGLWLKWVVGRQRSPVFGSNGVMARLVWVTVMGLVEIGVGHGNGFGSVGLDRLIVGLKLWIY